VHKTPLPQSSAQRHYTSLQCKFGGGDRTSYWASAYWKRDVSGKDQIQVMQVGEVDGDAWANGAVIAGMAYRWVPPWRVSCTCHGCNVSKPIHALYLHSFSSKMLVKGHCPGLVTSGGNVSHKNFTKMKGWLVMRPPFSWLCHQEPLPWRGDQMLVVSYC
jgi:hypothetical protein